MRGHYVGHMNMHNKVKAFQCQKCPKAFAHKSSLRYHVRNSDCGKCFEVVSVKNELPEPSKREKSF